MVVDQHGQVAAGLHPAGAGPLCREHSIAMAKPQGDAIVHRRTGVQAVFGAMLALLASRTSIGLQHFIDELGEQRRLAEPMTRSKRGESGLRRGRQPRRDHSGPGSVGHRQHHG